jgi:hypothetical protein
MKNKRASRVKRFERYGELQEAIDKELRRFDKPRMEL